ncbi:hypothetical protein, partial [Rhodoplanes serenus]|uniref:hypothetical protein n=1 Tax=Rhodoplanes serenus TaxID=200615 RepID=UPI000DBBF8CD
MTIESIFRRSGLRFAVENAIDQGLRERSPIQWNRIPLSSITRISCETNGSTLGLHPPAEGR